MTQLTVMTRLLQIICLLILALGVIAQSEGDACTLAKPQTKGKCLLLTKCEYAKKLLQNRGRPQNCGFKGNTPIVCCPLPKTQLRQPQQSKSKIQCGLYYPPPKVTLTLRKFVYGGEPSLVQEFPHMAILGFGDKNNIEWLCGGSLISDRFVLTAAHCVSSQKGKVHTVRLGDLNLKSNGDDAKPENFNVASTIVHPSFKPPSHYHDIALLKLDRQVKFNNYIKPICLYPNSTVPASVIATGWGKLEFFGQPSSLLMKVGLGVIPHPKCADSFKTASKAKLKNGIDNKSQLCAGDANGKDTCPGDSGGPLQIKVTNPTHYYQVGITSFGKACGVGSSVGVYTRISNYVKWIEGHVWP